MGTKAEQDEVQYKIPGTQSKQEAALEEEMQGYCKREGQIKDLQALKKEHKGHVDELMKALGERTIHKYGKKWKRDMKLTVTAETDSEETRAAKDEQAAKLPKGRKAEAADAAAAAS